MNRDVDKNEIISSHPIKAKGSSNIISGKRFDEVKVYINLMIDSNSFPRFFCELV